MRFALATSLLIAGLALGAGIAPAHGGSFTSTVKILDDENGPQPPMKRNYWPRFTGTVRSSKDACEPKRKVKLYREVGPKDALVGSDKTNANGRFRIVLDKPNTNDFYAVATSREIGDGTCKADKSPVFHHEPPF